MLPIQLLVASMTGATISHAAREVYMPTSVAMEIAEIIGRDEGYDIRNWKMYSFDLLVYPNGKPLVDGFISIGFYINDEIRSTMAIDKQTAQAIDVNSCEVFDYPDLHQFTGNTSRLTGVALKSPESLADEVGCENPLVVKIATFPSSTPPSK